MSTNIEQELENYYKFLETTIFKELSKISENSEKSEKSVKSEKSENFENSKNSEKSEKSMASENSGTSDESEKADFYARARNRPVTKNLTKIISKFKETLGIHFGWILGSFFPVKAPA